MLARFVVYGKQPELNTWPHGTVDFGRIRVNGDVVKAFSTMNIGSGQCAVDISFSDRKGSGAFTVDRAHVELPAQQQELFHVTFHPAAAGTFESQIMIRGTP